MSDTAGCNERMAIVHVLAMHEFGPSGHGTLEGALKNDSRVVLVVV